MRSHTTIPLTRIETIRGREWYRQPVLWLGMLLFAASLAGCVLMIVLGARHADTPLRTAGGEIAHMPLARATPPPESPRTAPR